MEYNSTSYAKSLFLTGLTFQGVWRELKANKGEKVLEIGCNQGILVKKMRERGIDTQGIDINPQAVKESLAQEVHVMDATSLQFPDNSFDKIYSLHTIEHITDVKAVFLEISRVLRPGGRVVLVYPAEPGILRGLFALKSAIIAYKNPFFARKIHVHSLNPGKIQELIKGTLLQHTRTIFPFLMFPQYLTILEKQI